ncbi:unnamed protein product [Linum tenue]|uniref:DNA-3-methyladenine glycosylase I n=1 Tax=Linum tenue TaxID=586396 RepID=A0AAV0RMI8_9ROSI|nr:unnamed protein product [Linum tenue]
MSAVAKLHIPAKARAEPRGVLVPAGNRVRVPNPDESKRKTEVQKKIPQQQGKSKRQPPVTVLASKVSPTAVKNNFSVDSVSSSEDSSSSSSAGSGLSGKKSNRGGELAVEHSPTRQEGPAKRCDWITPNSDPLYASFHDEEWGVPVYDDRRLLELLVFSQALAEMSWPEILHLRLTFRKLFDDFDPSSIAQFTEKKLLSLRINGHLLLSEQKLRAIVGNAESILKVQQEFGSFSSYLWRFVNKQPLRNGFRYARQVPAKTPKGFRCVGPTVVYSFMQAAGIVNDHLSACFRYHECNVNVENNKMEASESA